MSLNNFIPILRGKKDKVSLNFDMHELRCRSNDAPEKFLLDYDLILALEFIRDFSDSKILPSSTYRTPEQKKHLVKTAGAASDSQHTLNLGGFPATRALDFKFVSQSDVNILLLRKAVEEKNHIYQQLRQIGINGIGFYDTFIHLDTRVSQGMHVDPVYGRFAFWNEQKVLKKKTLQVLKLDLVTPTHKPYSSRFLVI